MPAVSRTKNFHVPSTGWPRSVFNGLIGFQVPVNGAFDAVTSAKEFAALSSNTTWHMLSPEPPLLLNTVAVAPDGLMIWPTRSPTKVWLMPTVVEPVVVLQTVPSIEKPIFDARPKPDTGIDTV